MPELQVPAQYEVPQEYSPSHEYKASQGYGAPAQEYQQAQGYTAAPGYGQQQYVPPPQQYAPQHKQYDQHEQYVQQQSQAAIQYGQQAPVADPYGQQAPAVNQYEQQAQFGVSGYVGQAQLPVQQAAAQAEVQSQPVSQVQAILSQPQPQPHPQPQSPSQLKPQPQPQLQMSLVPQPSGEFGVSGPAQMSGSAPMPMPAPGAVSASAPAQGTTGVAQRPTNTFAQIGAIGSFVPLLGLVFSIVGLTKAKVLGVGRGVAQVGIALSLLFTVGWGAAGYYAYAVAGSAAGDAGCVSADADYLRYNAQMEQDASAMTKGGVGTPAFAAAVKTYQSDLSTLIGDFDADAAKAGHVDVQTAIQNVSSDLKQLDTGLGDLASGNYAGATHVMDLNTKLMSDFQHMESLCTSPSNG